MYDMAADRKELVNRTEIKDFLMLLKHYNQNKTNDNKRALDDYYGILKSNDISHNNIKDHLDRLFYDPIKK